MKIFIVDTINNIPSHKQFQDLALALTAKGHKVVHVSDTKRDNYGIEKVIFRKNRLKDIPVYFKLLKSEKPSIVISTFRANKIFDILSYFFSFSFFPVYQSDFFSTGCKYRFYYRNATRVLTVSTVIKAKMEDIYYPHLKGRVETIGNSFIFSDSQKLNKENIVLCVANDSKNNKGKYVKGVDVLLEAWSRVPHPKWRLQIIGCDKNAYHAYLGTEKVEFYDRVSNKEVLEFMSCAKLFVLPSRNEAFGQVFIEAMSNDCALIGSRNTGAEDIIVQGDYGSIVGQESVEQLFVELTRMMKSYRSQKECELNYADKKDYFSRESWIKRIEKLVSEV